MWLENTAEETLRASEIPLEEINAPILLLSAGDDGIWPSRFLCNRVANRLEALEYDHQYEHRTYDDAGHGIYVPFLPTWPNRPNSDFGGTPAGTAAAEADAWPHVIKHFERGTGQ